MRNKAILALFTTFLLTMFVTTVSAYSGLVSRINDGQWASNYRAPSGVRYGWYWSANVWVDVAVQDVAFDKQVVVRWTTDNWQSYTDTPAVFEQDLAGGYEQWGANITPAAEMGSCYWCNPTSPTLQYAIYYTVNGQTYWDNNNGQNYQIVINNVYQ